MFRGFSSKKSGKLPSKPPLKPPLEDSNMNGKALSTNSLDGKPESQKSSEPSHPRPQFEWAMTMTGRSSILHNSFENVSKAPSFSVEDALNPTDPVVKHAVEMAVAVGVEDFKPLLAAALEERPSVSRGRAVAAALRALTKREVDKVNRTRVAAADGVDVLVGLLSSSDNLTVEHSVTALLNLSLTESVREYVFASSGAVRGIVNVLKTGSSTSKENAAASLFALADTPDRKLIIGESDAMGPLIDLLQSGTLRGKKDASLALFNLSLHSPCRQQMLTAGVIKPLISLLNTPDSGVEDKVVAIISNLVKGKEGRDAFMAEGSISLLVDIAEGGSPRAKEDATSALLSLARKSQEAVTELLQESPDVTFNKLTLQGTDQTKRKAAMLLDLLRLARNNVISSSEVEGYSFAESFCQTFRQEDEEDEDEDDCHT